MFLNCGSFVFILQVPLRKEIVDETMCIMSNKLKEVTVTVTIFKDYLIVTVIFLKELPHSCINFFRVEV